MSDSQADEIRDAVGGVLKRAAATGAVEVVFRAENVSLAVVGVRSNHKNVISALTTQKMQEQTGFAPGKVDRAYDSSAALISFKFS
jgi:hypothetical protein